MLRLRSTLLFVLIAFWCCYSQATAIEYQVRLIMPTTGGYTPVSNFIYNQWASSAKLAAANITAMWAAHGNLDTLTVNVSDNQNNMILGIHHANEAMSDERVHAVLVPPLDADRTSSVLSAESLPVLTPDAERVAFPVSYLGCYSMSPLDGGRVDALRALIAKYNWTSIGVVYVQNPLNLRSTSPYHPLTLIIPQFSRFGTFTEFAECSRVAPSLLALLANDRRAVLVFFLLLFTPKST